MHKGYSKLQEVVLAYIGEVNKAVLNYDPAQRGFVREALSAKGIKQILDR